MHSQQLITSIFIASYFTPISTIQTSFHYPDLYLGKILGNMETLEGTPFQ